MSGPGRGAGVRLRAGGRLLAWLAAVWLALFVFAALGAGRLPLPAAFALRAAVVAAVSLIAWRVLEGRRPRATPLAAGRPELARLAGGAGVGLALVAGALAVMAAFGGFRLIPAACEASEAVGSAGRLLALFLAAASLEEILFRGYGFSALRDLAGSAPAVAVTAALFSLAHAGNPHFDLAAAAAIAGIGAVLAAVVLTQGSVWGAVGIHAGWNWALAAVAGLPVSGLAFATPCPAGRVAGPAWLTGGEFGPEASVAAGIAWGALALALLMRRR